MKTLYLLILVFMNNVLNASENNPRVIAEWFEVSEIRTDLFLVREPSDGSFYILKEGKKALFIDSGFGLHDTTSKELLRELQIDSFDVLVTHSHCDHVGMNYLAKNIYINEIEWKKYLAQNEIEQIKHFYELLKDEVKWPKITKSTPVQRPWKPTKFINEGDIIRFGKWNLQAVSSPGHTTGHMFFYDAGVNAIFSGDLIYDGSLYAHMKDSDIQEYLSSLKILDKFIKNKKTDLILLPSHNSIPLKLDYVETAIDVLSRIHDKKIKKIKTEKGNNLFETADKYEENNVKIYIKN